MGRLMSEWADENMSPGFRFRFDQRINLGFHESQGMSCVKMLMVDGSNSSSIDRGSSGSLPAHSDQKWFAHEQANGVAFG
jgi:hypothetical protein